MVWLSVAPGTERYRLTDLHRRFNGDMNSASVSSFSTRETRRSVCGGGRKQKKQTRGNAHYYICPLRCWCTAYCPEVSSTVPMPISHWNCLCLGTDRSLWGDWADAVILRWNAWFKEERVYRGFFSPSFSLNTQLLSLTTEQLCTQTGLQLTKSFNDYT